MHFHSCRLHCNGMYVDRIKHIFVQSPMVGGTGHVILPSLSASQFHLSAGRIGDMPTSEPDFVHRHVPIF